jgi:hypothetical protein
MDLQPHEPSSDNFDLPQFSEGRAVADLFQRRDRRDREGQGLGAFSTRFLAPAAGRGRPRLPCDPGDLCVRKHSVLRFLCARDTVDSLSRYVGGRETDVFAFTCVIPETITLNGE